MTEYGRGGEAVAAVAGVARSAGVSDGGGARRVDRVVKMGAGDAVRRVGRAGTSVG